MDRLRTFCLLALLPIAAVAGGAEPIMARPATGALQADADPLDRLRERLAEKLGAAKAPDTGNPNVLRVTSRQTGETRPTPGAAAAKKPAGHDEKQHQERFFRVHVFRRHQTARPKMSSSSGKITPPKRNTLLICSCEMIFVDCFSVRGRMVTP